MKKYVFLFTIFACCVFGLTPACKYERSVDVEIASGSDWPPETL